jgi:hypothetical protein
LREWLYRRADQSRSEKFALPSTDVAQLDGAKIFQSDEGDRGEARDRRNGRLRRSVGIELAPVAREKISINGSCLDCKTRSAGSSGDLHGERSSWICACAARRSDAPDFPHRAARAGDVIRREDISSGCRE